MTTTRRDAAIAWPRRARRRLAASRSRAAVADDGGLGHRRDCDRGRDGASAAGAQLQFRRAPAAWLIQRWLISASSPESSSSSIAWETQAVSGESLASRAPHWSPPGAANWPTIVASRHLGGGQVERGRQVDDDRVDLAVLQRRDDVVGVVEDLRLARRLDLVVRPRRGWWCRSGRRSSRPSGRRARSRSAASESFERDDRLVGRVVGRREVDLPWRASA